jgi:hypothetical protein
LVSEETNPVVYFWFIGSEIPNDTPLTELNATFESNELNALIEYTSCLAGYPFNDLDVNWRKASMERRNRPTALNYRPEANNDIDFANANMRAIQIRQPFQNNGLENIVTLKFPTTDLEQIKVSFAADSDGAAESLILEYWNGLAWTNVGLAVTAPTLTDTYQLFEVDCSAIDFANNNPNFQLRIRFAGPNMSADEGKRVHFNNIAVEGVEVLSNDSFTRSFVLTAFPNPTNNMLNIKSNEPIQNLVIYNIFGQEVHKLNNVGEQTQVSMENLPLGVYLVKANWHDFQKTIRVIKE